MDTSNTLQRDVSGQTSAFQETLFSGAELVIKTLQDLDVKLLFGYPGGAVLDIYDALFAQSSIQHILVRHEQAAVHAADGYARATGKVGTVLVTSGPGATNTITGIATAYMDSIPLVILSGQVATHLIGEDAFQETDMIGCSRPIVKHSFVVTDPAEIPSIIAKAYYLASTGRPGPVVIDLPKNIASQIKATPYLPAQETRIRSYNPTLKGHPKQIKKAIRAFNEAHRPIFYIGGGIVNAAHSFRQLAEKLHVPVTSTLMGLGSFPGNHEQFLGMLGMHGTFEANKAMANADLIICFGARFDDRVTNNTEKFCPNATIIHVDIDPASISKTVTADIPIVGSCDKVVQQFLELIDRARLKPIKERVETWWQQIEQWRKIRCLKYEKGSHIKPQEVIETLAELTDANAFVTSDVGQHQMFTALYYPFNRPRQWINSGGLGTMGFGLPAAIGVQLAYPEQNVLCITGDGSIQMNIQELSTCLEYGLPIKVISLNNQSLGMVRQWQDMIYQARHSQSYMNALPDFVRLAEAYGHVGIRIEDPCDLKDKLEFALSLKEQLVFIDILVDAEEHVYPMQIKGGAIDDMILCKQTKQ